MHADVEGALRIAHLAKDYAWLWTTENAEGFCRLAQFQTDQRSGGMAALATSLKVDLPKGFLLSSPRLLASAGKPAQSITELSVDVTDTGDESSPTLHESLVDLFANLSDSFQAEFGAPTRATPGEYPEIGWDFDEVTILLTTMDSSIALGLDNPDYLRWWARGADSADDYRDAAAGRNPTRSDPLTWNELCDALLAAVTRLPEDVELILTTTDGSTVAFVLEGRLVSRVAPAPARVGRNSPDHQWFAANGWHPDSEGRVGDWERSIAWPARYSEYETAVDAAILVLREPLRVENPNEITVQAL